MMRNPRMIDDFLKFAAIVIGFIALVVMGLVLGLLYAKDSKASEFSIGGGLLNDYETKENTGEISFTGGTTLNYQDRISGNYYWGYIHAREPLHAETLTDTNILYVGYQWDYLDLVFASLALGYVDEIENVKGKKNPVYILTWRHPFGTQWFYRFTYVSAIRAHDSVYHTTYSGVEYRFKFSS